MGMFRNARRVMLCATAAMALAVPASAGAADYKFFGTTSGGLLVEFNKDSAGTIASRKPITGLPPGVSLVGIDFRPRTSELMGVGTDSRIYEISTASGFAYPLAANPFGTTLSGDFFGVDFNPTPDRIRLVSNAEQNLRLNPGMPTMSTADGPITRASDDPNIVHVAYQQSSFSQTQPTTPSKIFYIDSTVDTLYSAPDPNNPNLSEAKPLTQDVGERGGFDIVGSTNIGFVSRGAGSDATQLLRVNLVSGQATPLSRIGGKLRLTGLAVVQPVAGA